MSKVKPLVSIIMPLYNCEKYVKESIESVINQTYKQWELIIVDDKSSDNGLSIVESLMEDEDRIILIKKSSNEGAAKARNKGINISKGKYIAFLDSDDIWVKDKLEKQISFMEKNKIYFSFTSYKRIYSNNKTKVIKAPYKVNFLSTLMKNSITTPSVIINIKQVGKVYFPDVEKREDYALWLKLLKEDIKYAYGIDEILTFVKKRKDSVSADKIKLIKYQWNLYRNFLGVSIITSLLLLIKDIIIKLLRIK